MKQTQLVQDPTTEELKLNALDGFQLFYEEMPMKVKNNGGRRLQRPSRTNSK